MNVLCRLTLGFMIVFLSTFACDLKQSEALCESKGIISKIRKQLHDVNDYQLEAVVTIKNERLSSMIIGKKPDRLLIRLDMPESSFQKTMTAIFDGEYQWVELVSPSSTQVMKIQLKEITLPGRPFDTGYYIMGSGLFNGEGYPESIEIMLSIYDLDAVCSDSRILLQGPIRVNQFKQYALKKRSAVNSESGVRALVEKFARNFGYLSMEFSAGDLIIKTYSMGSSKDKDEFSVQFKKVLINQKVKNETFFYKPPPGISPVDITKDLKLQLGIGQ